MNSEQLKRYGREESKEHRLSLKMGEKLARDHIRLYGDAYYQRMDMLEKKLKRKK